MEIRSLAARLTTRRLGRPLVYAPRLTSTQALAARLSDLGWPDGTTVLAEEQTAGRGRGGRSWWAPYGQALLFSILLRPGLPSRRAQQLVMVAGLAAAEAVEAVCPVSVALKWPNDLYVRERKVGGILLEARLAANGQVVERAIVGIGINVSVDFAGLPDLQGQAVSLHEVAGHAPDRGALLVAILSRFEAHYQEVLAGGSCRAAWLERLLWMGREVQVTTPRGAFVGVARGVDEEGALLLECADGVMEVIRAGDVSLRTSQG